MADAPKLLPCPFCGNAAIQTRAPWGALVRCTKDECAGRWGEATPAAWNARSPASAARLLLESPEAVERMARGAVEAYGHSWEDGTEWHHEQASNFVRSALRSIAGEEGPAG